MKRLLALLGLTGISLPGQTQTFAEWFEQNKTQLKYLHEQLFALEEEDETLEEGYAVDETGLVRIAGNKQADLDLHTRHFSTLRDVNMVILADPRVSKIVSLTEETQSIGDSVRRLRNVFPRLRASVDAVCDDLDELCVAGAKSLEQLLQDGATQMTDAERLEKLENLYEEAKELNEIARNYWADAEFFTSIANL
ncbi:MAG TPA: hypothetical protein VHE34_22360 [Puia sp.]|uniref:hypothetical protein n=1 Tax=Puia sp. TaxID=2045100 RepID=UPI002CDC699C|nr:hypothetical protein [Puia sp.]HVU97991.1 hypothetical protein [Puia sp.]